MDRALKGQKVVFIGHSDFVKLGSNYLEIREDAPNEVLASVASKLKVIDGALNWYVGDFALMVGRIRGSEKMEAFLKTWNVKERNAHDSRLICETFPPSDRLDGLTWTHFKNAQEGCDTKEEMMEWLNLAMNERLSATKMREMIRHSYEETGKPSVTTSSFDFHAIYGSIKFTTVHFPTDLPPEDRATLKQSAPRMVEWWKQLAEV